MGTTLQEIVAPPRSGPETMHAVVVHAFDEPPRVEEVAKPITGTGEVLVKIEASGVKG
jgi:D-arabinose 1-dehydrogenase-like Zn-dependent alcohol dehydrogenase